MVYVQQEKIDTAKSMLLYNDYSVSEISTILCFSSESHFIKSFQAAKWHYTWEISQEDHTLVQRITAESLFQIQGRGMRGFQKTEYSAAFSLCIGKFLC